MPTSHDTRRARGGRAADPARRACSRQRAEEKAEYIAGVQEKMAAMEDNRKSSIMDKERHADENRQKVLDHFVGEYSRGRRVPLTGLEC